MDPPMRVTPHVAQAIAPWASIVVLSATLAFGLQQLALHGPFEPLPAQADLPMPAAGSLAFTALPVPTEPGATWVILSSKDPQGAIREQACLTPPDTFAAESLELAPTDMDRLIANLQCVPH
jgi:hypothetical protein